MSSPKAKTNTALAAFAVALAALTGCTGSAPVAAAVAATAAPIASETPTAISTPTETPQIEPAIAEEGESDILYDLGYGHAVSTRVIPDGCPSYAMIIMMGKDGGNGEVIETAALGGEPFDRGPHEHATGEVGLNAEGQIETYTVASGDYIEQIGERLCMDEVYLAKYNLVNRVGYKDGYHDLYPGEVLTIRPDPDAVWEGGQ